MTKEEILEKVKNVKGLGGMTTNERLYVAGLIKVFDKAKKKDKELAQFVLQAIGVDNPSINKILKL